MLRGSVPYTLVAHLVAFLALSLEREKEVTSLNLLHKLLGFLRFFYP